MVSISHAANESNPISVCSFCSDSRAGVRWMVHGSNANRPFDEKIRLIGIKFQCEISEENVVSITEFMLQIYLIEALSISYSICNKP